MGRYSDVLFVVNQHGGKRKERMRGEDGLQQENISDTKQRLEGLGMKVEVTRSAMRERDAEVSSELKAMGGRFEEASSKISELSEEVEELRGQSDQLQDMVQRTLRMQEQHRTENFQPDRALGKSRWRTSSWAVTRCGGSWAPEGTRFFAAGYQQPGGSLFWTCRRCWETY